MSCSSTHAAARADRPCSAAEATQCEVFPIPFAFGTIALVRSMSPAVGDAIEVANIGRKAWIRAT